MHPFNQAQFHALFQGRKELYDGLVFVLINTIALIILNLRHHKRVEHPPPQHAFEFYQT